MYKIAKRKQSIHTNAEVTTSAVCKFENNICCACLKAALKTMNLKNIKGLFEMSLENKSS